MSFLRNLRDAIQSLQTDTTANDDDLFTLPQALFGSSSPTYGIPKRPSKTDILKQSRAAWVPPRRPVTIAGRTITVGMLYVGTRLDPIAGWETQDAALVDPSLSTVGQGPPSALYGHRSSYAKFDPEIRGMYLDWLSFGAPLDAPLELAYLRLYGLERRILFDAQHDQAARDELPLLIEEAQRLDELLRTDYYGGHTTNLLLAASALYSLPSPDEVVPRISESGWELPFAVRTALGLYATQRRPIPPNWALSWICADRDTQLRTPAYRCRDEFELLFMLRYAQQFGEGMVVKPPKPHFPLAFWPANPSFGQFSAGPNGSLPDLSRVRKPQSQLREIVFSVTAELDDYSRTIGNDGDPFAPLALAARPAAVGDIADFPSIAPLKTVLQRALGGSPVGLIETDTLTSSIPGLSSPPTQKQATAISTLSNRLGFGLEPNPRTMRTEFVKSERVGVYRLEPKRTGAPTLTVQRACLSIGALVLQLEQPFDDTNQHWLLNLVATAYPISIDDTLQLAAYAAWLGDRPIALAEIKRLWGKMSAQLATPLTSVAISAANRDGTISVDETRVLEKLYRMVGLPEHHLHSDLHQRLSGRPGVAAKPARKGEKTGAVTLDTHTLREVKRQTDAIHAVLGAVFVDDASETSAPSTIAATDQPVDALAMLIASLNSSSTITMDEFSARARELGLMPAGAIERINERAIERGFDPPIECDDLCDIDTATLKELLAHD